MARRRMLFRKVKRTAVITGLLLLLIAFNIVLAQSTAQVSGTVKDQSGAVCPAWRSPLFRPALASAGRR
jgi:hypothetical protein